MSPVEVVVVYVFCCVNTKLLTEENASLCKMCRDHKEDQKSYHCARMIFIRPHSTTGIE